MQPWTTVEYGSLWALESDDDVPPIYEAQVETIFDEVGIVGSEELMEAMNLLPREPFRQRLKNGRRCFVLKVTGQIVTYGWVTAGMERVGELERDFHLNQNEAYVWDCGTLPAWRGLGCYSALLSHIIYKLFDEGFVRIWIGASRQNQPSIKGIVNAGFKPVIDCTYRRFYRLTMLTLQKSQTAVPALISAAYRIMVNDHERRIGNMVVGYKR
jgi:GNAT superfamily N-acetyltransferase